ncbi:protein phosphatase 2C domain-containing protein [Salinactinospora qingdaonensis]|uniref:Protein phosphatase 2C domain-containing protein n=1 Tax=Salinactinospora qingdaonensis TaxID=702744 RepID=A0ABP7GFN9_9ACTN
MLIAYASEQGDGEHNEDLAMTGPGWALVLDGATAPPGVDNGCRHGVRWLVSQLAAGLARFLLPEAGLSLSEALARAIECTCEAHRATCDLGNPDSPSSTVALVRRTDTGFDYLVLGDSAVLVPGPDGAVTAFSDTRLDHLPGGRPYSAELVRASRNAPGGFWVAGTSPQAAAEAVTGSVRAEEGRFALLTDGCTRLVDHYGYRWRDLWRRLAESGPAAVIAWVREQERRHGVERGKLHDDATALWGDFAGRGHR